MEGVGEGEGGCKFLRPVLVALSKKRRERERDTHIYLFIFIYILYLLIFIFIYFYLFIFIYIYLYPFIFIYMYLYFYIQGEGQREEKGGTRHSLLQSSQILLETAGGTSAHPACHTPPKPQQTNNGGGGLVAKGFRTPLMPCRRRENGHRDEENGNRWLIVMLA